MENIHDSTSCSCYTGMNEEEFMNNIQRSIDLYKISTSFIEFVNKKLVYVSIRSKIKLLNYNCEDIIENTIFNNCHCVIGYLFRIQSSFFGLYTINIKNSTFINTSSLIYGFDNDIKISDSSFQNITQKISVPAIIDSKFSSFLISNSEFSNLK
ncbi:hypothetical protein PIROE2DRAFT_15146 [Piromyces sp. E2]|nr:hypothetical protein PIROE2DRAFT_15146 [Piromyces sp. E2]|eukprot:OUM59347.1 hypothetical protein PIROE2DRAFT_15146 [Piromyces sp. E2]